jgi:hypothetical protein
MHVEKTVVIIVIVAVVLHVEVDVVQGVLRGVLAHVMDVQEDVETVAVLVVDAADAKEVAEEDVVVVGTTVPEDVLLLVPIVEIDVMADALSMALIVVIIATETAVRVAYHLVVTIVDMKTVEIVVITNRALISVLQ